MEGDCFMHLQEITSLLIFRLRAEETYCAAVCASLALFAGSGDTANCKGFRNGLTVTK